MALWESGQKKSPKVWRKISSEQESDDENGGASASQYQLERPPLQIIDTIRLFEVPLFRNKSFLHQKYVVERLSIKQIATEIMSSTSSVRKGLLSFGIEIRSKSQHHGDPAQVKFGQKRKLGKLEDHQREQRVIKMIKHLKGQGLSLRAIAKTLNELKVPTKNQGKMWHPEMVKRVLSYIK